MQIVGFDSKSFSNQPMPILPKFLNYKILEIVLNSIVNDPKEDARKKACRVADLMRLNKAFKVVFEGVLKAMKEDLKDFMINKYSALHLVYKFRRKDKSLLSERFGCKKPLLNVLSSQNKKEYPIGYPQLIDALQSGLPKFDKLITSFSSYRSVDEYTSETTEDIKSIITLLPSSIHCRLGRQNKRRLYMLPLAVACLNPNVPLDVIEFMLEKKASMHEKHLLGKFADDSTPITIYDDVESHMSIKESRRKAIMELFDKYFEENPKENCIEGDDRESLEGEKYKEILKVKFSEKVESANQGTFERLKKLLFSGFSELK